MNTKQVLKKADYSVSKENYKKLTNKVKMFLDYIEKDVRSKSLDFDIFLGGSYAKKTLVNIGMYDVDIFLRFDKKYTDLNKAIHEISKKISKKHKVILLHGSRDYIRIEIEKGVIIELIPIRKVKNVKEAENVTDLSYFHVNYVSKHSKQNVLNEIVKAKQFLKAAGVYGAESYINGFSGYAVECLIIHYGSLAGFLKGVIESKDKIIIDQLKHYKNKEQIKIELNESKLKNPIVLIDPVDKRRNVLAALSNESFEKLREYAKSFMKKPSMEYFEVRKDWLKRFEKMQGKDVEFVKIIMQTDRQQGDIAGTKMKKFFTYLKSKLDTMFATIDSEFIYEDEDKSLGVLALKSKKEIIKNGPFDNMSKHVKKFKAEHSHVFKKKNRFYAREKIDMTAKEYLTHVLKRDEKIIKSMDITNVQCSEFKN